MRSDPLRQTPLEIKLSNIIFLLSVEDNDGQFLLIEAADHIPHWIKPENSKFRVWINNSSLNIIPIPRDPMEIMTLPVKLTPVTALDLIQNQPVSTIASEPVKKCIDDRLVEYPKKARESLHRSRCIVPESIAKILHKDPQLIAPAVNSFFYRDLVAMRACNVMEKFNPKKEKMVELSLTFTRCLFAQMDRQNFHAPKPFKEFLPQEKDPKYKAALLGMKLVCIYSYFLI